MTIPVGQRLGPYEILSAIGAGGMGEVYRAHDARLNRDVALKVLPETFAADPDRMVRFEREARVLGALNHPNIAAIYGLEEFGSGRALVMELVAGETLADRIAKGPIPLDEALPIAKQMAEALEYAHDRGVIHRDLKPANIKVTADGAVKVLDFGLAKALLDEPVAADPRDSPTLSMAPTMAGAILGTAAYMSPEQAKGKAVDRRADIWAFGCVVFEMLTGKPAFQGEDTTEILAAVVMKEPSLDGLPSGTQSAIRNLLRRCLEKNTRQRLQHIGEARIVIEDVLSGAVPQESGGAHRNTRERLLIPGAAVAVIAIVAVVVALAFFRRPPTQDVSRLMINLPAGQRLTALDQPALAISPDGKNLVYVAVQDSTQSPDRKREVAGLSTQQLYLRPLDSLEAKPISGTEGAVGPFFSPDGQWVGFFAGQKLKKVPVNGGAAVTITTAVNPAGASWSGYGTLAFQGSSGSTNFLKQVAQDGGTPQPLALSGVGVTYQAWPDFLPDGKEVLSAATATVVAWNNAQIFVQPTATGKAGSSAQVGMGLAQGTQPRYASSGHLLYAQAGALMAAPFDAKRLALTGPSVPVLGGLMQSAVTGAAQYSVSSTGTLVYLAGTVAGSQSRLVWVSRSGEEQLLPAAPHIYLFPRVSPDGRRVGVQIEAEDTQVSIYDVIKDTLTRLTFEGNVNVNPTWSPDGKRIVFSSNRAGPLSMFLQEADGSGGAERLATSDHIQATNSISSDGKLLAFVDTSIETGRDIWVLQLSDRKSRPFLRTRYEETAPKFSPDGEWLAYSSDESGRREIYVQSYPGPGGKWQISTDGGQEPVWNPKGGELFYRSGSKIMAVQVDTKSGFSAGKPKMLFEGPYLPTSGSFPNYDVSPDGQRFLMLKPVESQASAPTQINVVQNWFEELKQKVPPGKK